MEDFLHFHLAGSCDYGDEGEAHRQRTLWMTAGRLGVLVDVDKIKNWRGEPVSSVSGWEGVDAELIGLGTLMQIEDGQVHSFDDD